MQQRERARVHSASLLVRVPPERVCAAFLNPEEVARWLPPQGMRAEIHRYEPRNGGAYEMVLTYERAADQGSGKTSASSDVVRGRFVEVTPRRVVQTVVFESANPAFGGEMTMTWTLAAVPDGTQVTVEAQDVPLGISADDHEAGFRATLANLADVVEPRRPGRQDRVDGAACGRSVDGET